MGIWEWATSWFVYWLYDNREETPAPAEIAGVRTASTPFCIKKSEESFVVDIRSPTPSYESLSPRLSMEAYAELLRESAHK